MKLLRVMGQRRMTDGEYRANLAGMNTFFGAVLGFVLSGIENLDTFRFGYLLTLLAGVVISILYISASNHRLLYAIYTLALVFLMPVLVEPVLPPTVQLPAKLQATLVVWTAMTILVEFIPRHRDEPSAPAG